MPSLTPSANEALTPVASQARVFQWHDHASLWFSLGVGLLVMQVGAYLVPALGTQQALLAIVTGSIVGAGLLGWVAKIGCDSGLASAGLMHAVYGRGFASLPILLNIVQLVGWGTFELVVMRDATVAIGRQSGLLAAAWWPVAATLLWGGVVALLISGSMVRLVRRVIARVALWLGGIACYHLLPRVLPGLGAALPTLALCLVLAWLTRPRGACSTRRSTH